MLALLPYLFMPMHMVKVCPMLLKIGHVPEINGTGKWDAGLQQGATGLTGILCRPHVFVMLLVKSQHLQVDYELKNLLRQSSQMLILAHSFLCLSGRSLLKDTGYKKVPNK
uniref:Uncharacterized protein n=1 Tax=Arundo donax TaxID=35708 RepID=A0A0A9D876_ARUDO